jgi:hypothetical protein
MSEVLDLAVIDTFTKWCEDDWFVDPTIKPLSNKVLIQLYYHFVPIKVDNGLIVKGKNSFVDHKGRTINIDLGDDEKPNLGSRLFPIAKILSVGNLTANYSHLKPGDIVYVDDYITDAKVNEDWVDWSLKTKDDPEYGRKIPEPPLMIGVISKWEQYRYNLDKFGGRPHVKDSFTYLVPESFILALDEQIKNTYISG